MDVFELLALRGTRKVLKALASDKRLRYSDLVKVVGFSTTTSRALKRMEAMGLVEKQVLNEPYRPVAYWLTAKGKKLATAIYEIESVA